LATGSERRVKRAGLWAEEILAQLPRISVA
jgi:hypothetical protein